jgi:hypothetical protein
MEACPVVRHENLRENLRQSDEFIGGHSMNGDILLEKSILYDKKLSLQKKEIDERAFVLLRSKNI